VNLSAIDLNLLLVLHTVLEEGSATGAARKLSVTQSAVSNSLARLRSLLGDPLVVRSGRGIVPTPAAPRAGDPAGRAELRRRRLCRRPLGLRRPDAPAPGRAVLPAPAAASARAADPGAGVPAALGWHPRTDADPAVAYLRELVVDVLAEPVPRARAGRRVKRPPR
jgi:hypothetical protein